MSNKTWQLGWVGYHLKRMNLAVFVSFHSRALNFFVAMNNFCECGRRLLLDFNALTLTFKVSVFVSVGRVKMILVPFSIIFLEAQFWKVRNKTQMFRMISIGVWHDPSWPVDSLRTEVSRWRRSGGDRGSGPVSPSTGGCRIAAGSRSSWGGSRRSGRCTARPRSWSLNGCRAVRGGRGASD